MNSSHLVLISKSINNFGLTKGAKTKVRETLEVIDGTTSIYSDLQSKISLDFYALFVKSTDKGFRKKQNSFILFKNNLETVFRHRQGLFTLANCYFRLKNLVQEQLPKLALMSELETDLDLFRLKQLQKDQTFGQLEQNIKELERQWENQNMANSKKSKRGNTRKSNQDPLKISDSNIQKNAEKWVEMSILDCFYRFRLALLKTRQNSQKSNRNNSTQTEKQRSFRSQFKSTNFQNGPHEMSRLLLFSMNQQGAEGDLSLGDLEKSWGDLDCNLLLFFRLLAVKFRIKHPLTGQSEFLISDELEQILEIYIVGSGLKYLILWQNERVKTGPSQNQIHKKKHSKSGNQSQNTGKYSRTKALRKNNKKQGLFHPSGESSENMENQESRPRFINY